MNVGKTIYVTKKGWISGEEPNLEEVEIIKMNKTSIYVKTSSNQEIRLSVKKLEGKDTLSHYQGYLSPDDYWEVIDYQKRRKELSQKVKEKIEQLSLEELEQLENWLKNKTTKKENINENL